MTAFQSRSEYLLEEALDVLHRVGCQFWACEGPDKPYEDMKTCHRCHTVQRIEQYLKSKEN